MAHVAGSGERPAACATSRRRPRHRCQHEDAHRGGDGDDRRGEVHHRSRWAIQHGRPAWPDDHRGDGDGLLPCIDDPRCGRAGHPRRAIFARAELPIFGIGGGGRRSRVGSTGDGGCATVAGAAHAWSNRQRVPDAADTTGDLGDRGIRQPSGGPRRIARPESDGHGRCGSSRSIPVVRVDERVQSRNHSAIRPCGRRLQCQIRRSPFVAAAHRKSQWQPSTAARGIGVAQHHRRQRRARRCAAAWGVRIVARHRAPHVLRPGG